MPAYTRPEYVLARAEKLIEDNKKEYALEVLHDAIKQRRPRVVWEKKHEDIMLRHVELCVELSKPQLAKDALWQYRGMVQQTNVNSLETVINKFLDLARARVDEAVKETKGLICDIDDLEQAESPETLLLKSVTSQDAAERIKKEKMAPALRFLWDSYKNCLELLRNNAQLEDKYHQIARSAYKFCITYQRRTEFRKLCDSLRTHLSYIQRGHSHQNAVKLDNPRTLEEMQRTRLEQLETAFTMEMWTEAFKSSEDVHKMFELSRQQERKMRGDGLTARAPLAGARIQIVAAFYEKLAKVFWMSENTLFHAAALIKVYQIMREFNKQWSQIEQSMATRCLLSVMAVGTWSERPSDMARLNDMAEQWLTNQRELTKLLELPATPTRAYLLRELQRLRIVDSALPGARELYNLMEKNFAPLTLCKRSTALLESIGKNELAQYIAPIQRCAAARSLKQIAQVYESMQLQRLREVIPYYDRSQLEAFIVYCTRHSYIQAQIDHRISCVKFHGHSRYEKLEESTNSEVTSFDVVTTEEVATDDGVVRELASFHALLRGAYFLLNSKEVKQTLWESVITEQHKAASHARSNWEYISVRRQMIEQMKQHRRDALSAVQRRRQERAQEEERYRMEIVRREEAKLQSDLRKKQQEDYKRQAKQMSLQHKLDTLSSSALGAIILREEDPAVIEEMDIGALHEKWSSRLGEELAEQTRKQREQEQKWDYFVRAVHVEEIEERRKATKEWIAKEREAWTRHEQMRIESARHIYEQQCKDYALQQKVYEDAMQFLAAQRPERAEKNNRQQMKWKERVDAVRAERRKALGDKLEAQERARLREDLERAKKEEKLRKEREEEERRMQERSQPRLGLDRSRPDMQPSAADQSTAWRKDMKVVGQRDALDAIAAVKQITASGERRLPPPLRGDRPNTPVGVDYDMFSRENMAATPAQQQPAEVPTGSWRQSTQRTTQPPPMHRQMQQSDSQQPPQKRVEDFEFSREMMGHTTSGQGSYAGPHGSTQASATPMEAPSGGKYVPGAMQKQRQQQQQHPSAADAVRFERALSLSAHNLQQLEWRSRAALPQQQKPPPPKNDRFSALKDM